MKFLPFEDFYIITGLKPGQVQERLEKEVEPDMGFSFKKLFSPQSGRYFTGYVVNGTFGFKRIIQHRNSFLPQIKGSTEAWLNGSRVHVKMSMHIGVTIFMCIWLGFALLLGFGFFIQEIRTAPFKIEDLAPFGAFLFGYLLSLGGFKYESIKAQKKLFELLNGELAK
ncbi:MAG: hypothetical protein ACXVJD_03460 [Mucilaginibacter sp.]